MMDDENIHELARQVISRYRSACWMLGTSESVTGGAISAELARIDGCSEVLFAGQVLYSIPGKKTFCGVTDDFIQEHGTVSPETALVMARCMTRHFLAWARGRKQKRDWAGTKDGTVPLPACFTSIATCGIAGKSIENKERGTAHVACIVIDVQASLHGEMTVRASSVKDFRFEGTRRDVIGAVTRAGLIAALEGAVI